MYLHHLPVPLSCFQSGFQLGLHDFTFVIKIMYFIFDSETTFKSMPIILVVKAVFGHISIGRTWTGFWETQISTFNEHPECVGDRFRKQRIALPLRALVVSGGGTLW